MSLHVGGKAPRNSANPDTRIQMPKKQEEKTALHEINKTILSMAKNVFYLIGCLFGSCLFSSCLGALCLDLENETL